MTSTNADLEQASEVADAKLGVAKELAWPLALLAGIATHFRWENWLLSIEVAVGAYLLVVFFYRRGAAAAEDQYYRAAGLGKHAFRRPPPTLGCCGD
jgi:hypothetical protein